MLPAPSLAADRQRPATVLLITDRSLAEAWRPLADWKTRAGKATEIVTVQDIEEIRGIAVGVVPEGTPGLTGFIMRLVLKPIS